MKDNILTLVLMLLFLNACCGQVNTTDPQISKNIRESKKNGFFVREYVVSHSTDNTIIVEEAWLEKAWFYEIHKGKVLKVAREYHRLCFNVKQTSNLKYNLKNLSEWLMEYKKTGYYVGIAYGIYELGLRDSIVPDSISLDLIKRRDNGGDVIDTKVGTLVFKVKPAVPSGGQKQ